MAHFQTSSFSTEFNSLKVTGVQLTGKKLGKGSDAVVKEANWLGTLCAAKELHDILLEDESPGGAKRFIENFERECMTWSTLVHPHIVQFLGICFLSGTRVPVLILEKMDTSLRNYLEFHKREEFPLPNKVYILRQVAQALGYLHSRKPPLVHHDLSPNNILLKEGSLQAKVTDFGMTRILDSSRMTRKSSVKGTPAFMPPESQNVEELPRYNDKLDVFSYGNVIVTVTTHMWPNPGPATKLKGKQLIAVSEIQRRKRYIDFFTPKESELFLPVVQACLQNDPSERPTSNQLVAQMSKIEEAHPRVPDAVVIGQLRQSVDDKNRLLDQKDTQLQESQKQLREKDLQLREKDLQLREKDLQLCAKDVQLREKDAQLREKEAQLYEKDVQGSYAYELFSVVGHSGSVTGGHSNTYIKSFSNQQWYCCNDHNVTTTTIPEVEQAFGGTVSSSGYYSTVYSSSANAYMLIYRQVTEDNESFAQIEDFPEYLKKIVLEEEKKKEQRRKELSSLKLFYHHPQSGNLLYKKMDIHRDDTLRDATNMGYKLLELEKFGVPREQCRIVRYDGYYNLIEKSWGGMDDDPICKVFGGNKRYYPFELFMERKEPSQEFPHYDETEIVIKFHIVDLSRSSSHGAILPTRCIRLLPNKTILELKERIAEVVGLPPDLIRILWEKYHNETIVLDDDTITLKSAGMHRKTKIFVEGSDEVDFQLPMETCRFKHTVEEYLHLIHVDVYMPEEGTEEKTTNADYSYKSESEKLIEGPPLFVVKIDKRKTLGNLKELLAEKINLEPLFFKIFRVYGNSQEFELYRLEDSLRANPESTKIIIRKGRALQTDEFRVKMFLLDVAQAEHCKELFEIIIGKGHTIGQVKEIILETAKESGVELGFGVEHMRIRRKQWRNPGIIFLDDMVVAKDFQIFLNMEFFVEVLPGPEPMQQSNHIQVYLRRWRPSEMTVGKFEEIIISSSKVANMKKKISDLSGIPVEHVEFAKGHGTFPQDISVLDVDKDLNWSPDCETISSHPLYITTDGCLLYYRDAEEKLKEMSNEEMEELRKKENKRLNKYYSSGYGSSTSTRSWTRKEKALKIYTEDDTVTSTATTTTTSDDLGLD